MSLGSIYLKLKQRYQHGLRPLYYMEKVRPRILDTVPMENTVNDACELHVLTWKGDWLNVIWMLKSLIHFGEIDYKLCIHEDGSLGQYEIETIQKHFPAARVIDRGKADSDLTHRLRGLPRSLEYRRQNPLALKVYDFSFYLESDRMLLLDSDILFFSRPVVLLDRIANVEYKLNSFNKDWTNGYSIDHSRVSPTLDFRFPELINSGLGLLHKGVVDIDQCEEFLGLPDIMSHHHRIEQTLIALCASKSGFEFLPGEYDVHLDDFVIHHCERHFTGPIRHRMYSEGIRHLVKQNFLESL